MGSEPDRILHEGRGQGQSANPGFSSLILFCIASQEARAGGCVSVHRMSRHEGKNTLKQRGVSKSGFVIKKKR